VAEPPPSKKKKKKKKITSRMRETPPTATSDVNKIIYITDYLITFAPNRREGKRKKKKNSESKTRAFLCDNKD
jgi:hypothetical protein